MNAKQMIESVARGTDPDELVASTVEGTNPHADAIRQFDKRFGGRSLGRSTPTAREGSLIGSVTRVENDLGRNPQVVIQLGSSQGIEDLYKAQREGRLVSLSF